VVPAKPEPLYPKEGGETPVVVPAEPEPIAEDVKKPEESSGESAELPPTHSTQSAHHDREQEASGLLQPGSGPVRGDNTAKVSESLPPAVAKPPEEPTRPGKEHQALFFAEAAGGVLFPKNFEAQPGGGMGFGVNLGKLIGWTGLYVAMDVDTFVGESLLGDLDYVMFDILVGLRGRFQLGPVRPVVGVGFGLRLMAVTRQPGHAAEEPEVGFGVSGTAGVEVPITDLVFVLVQAEGRFMRDPLTGQFRPYSVFVGGVGFDF
jgi:hypothetical protein